MPFHAEGPLVVGPPEDAGSGLRVPGRRVHFSLLPAFLTSIRAGSKHTLASQAREGWRNGESGQGVRMGWLIQEVRQVLQAPRLAGRRNCYCRWPGCPGERHAERWPLTREGTLTVRSCVDKAPVGLLPTLLPSPSPSRCLQGCGRGSLGRGEG